MEPDILEMYPEEMPENFSRSTLMCAYRDMREKIAALRDERDELLETIQEWERLVESIDTLGKNI